MIPSRNYEVAGSIPGLAQWVKNLAMSCSELWCGLQLQLGVSIAMPLA